MVLNLEMNTIRLNADILNVVETVQSCSPYGSHLAVEYSCFEFSCCMLRRGVAHCSLIYHQSHKPQPPIFVEYNSYYPLLIIQIPPNAPFKLPLSKTHCIQHPPPRHSSPCPCPEVKISHSVGVRAPQTPLTL